MLEKLDKNCQFRKKLKEILMMKTNTGENIPIILYGTGNISKKIECILDSFGLSSTAYVVSDSHYGSKINNISKGTVIKYSDLKKKYPENILIIANDNLRGEQLKQIEGENKHVIKIVTPIFDGMDTEYIKTNENKFDMAYDFLEDDLSKKTFVNFINGCINFDYKYISQIYQGEAYFIEGFDIKNEEVFIDAGAFDGDTMKSFMKSSDGKYKKYYAFEPDNINYEKLSLNSKNYTDVIPMNIGLYSEKSILKFNELEGASSKVDDNGTQEINVDTIDNLCKDATFIKMDVEGSEIEAIKGAKNVISKNKPKLAICVYHKKEHLTDALLYLKSIVPEYKFYLRQHNEYNATDLVLYCKL